LILFGSSVYKHFAPHGVKLLKRNAIYS